MQNLLEKLGLGERATSMVVWIGLSVLLLVIVIALAVWLVRTLRPSLNISGGQGRGGRPQRLAITDAFNLDREGRRLVIVRRDNVEHLLLIGGPNDVVVESTIVRGERVVRDRGGRIISESDAAFAAEAALTTELTRAEQAVPAPVAAPPPPAPAARPMPPAPTLQMRAPAAQPAPQPTPAVQQQPAPRLDDDFERAFAAMPVPAARPAPPQQPATQPVPQRPTPAPMQPVAPPIAQTPQQPAPVAPPPPPPPAPPPAAPPAPPRQEPVSEMARRLNEVLQKPLSGTLRAPFNKPIPPVPATMNSAPKPQEPATPPPPPVQQAASPPPAAPPALPPMPEAPATPVKTASTELEMDMLEEEMARLLGRPAQPTKPGAS